jgi:arginine decarboxylase
MTGIMQLPRRVSNKETVIGNRIPRHYFISKGVGESDITIHAGSYHLALKKAGIEVCNIMVYSSIMPSISKQIIKPSKFIHGEVMESICAVAHSEKGNRATAGIIIGWLFDKKSGKRYGGLVCEHNGDYSLKEIKKKLKESLNELYIKGFDKKYYLKKIEINTETIIPKKKYGTSLVCIGFVDYVVPIISQ